MIFVTFGLGYILGGVVTLLAAYGGYQYAKSKEDAIAPMKKLK